MTCHATPAESDPGRREELAARFAAQARFCTNNSPLYHKIFGLAGRRSAEDEGFAGRLLAAARGRSSYDVPLLTAAALHFQVLRAAPEAADLAAYYPSVGGTADAASPAFRDALFAALDALWDEIAAFIAARPVQTNEIARGLCWTLPLAHTGLPVLHLAELGASAGLNLRADQRSCEIAAGEVRVRIGAGAPCCEAAADAPIPPPGPLPRILSRNGCDLAPVDLTRPGEAEYLTAFVWPDQSERLRRLRAGIAAFRRVQAGPVPVRLASCRLPDELPGWLAALPRDEAPLLIFNTYIGIYLPDRGRGLAPLLDAWARQRRSPTLWLQWEHPKSAGVGEKAPEFGWLAWTADLWSNGARRRFHLAWVHPHGGRIQWLPGLAEWGRAAARTRA